MEPEDDFDDVGFIKPRLHIPPAITTFDLNVFRRVHGLAKAYAWATGILDLADAAPGEMMSKAFLLGGSGRPRIGQTITAAEIRTSVERDGLIYHGENLPFKGNVMAIFTKEASPNKSPEIICVRRDEEFWSYLPPINGGGCDGSGLPRQVDFSGNMISHPHTANFGEFKRFLGNVSISEQGVRYIPRVELPAVP